MSSPMDKPTCETCPYWERNKPHKYEDEAMVGTCHRYPIRGSAEIIKGSDNASEVGVMLDSDYPETLTSEWCGEHPDFPAYIELLKSQK